MPIPTSNSLSSPNAKLIDALKRVRYLLAVEADTRGKMGFGLHRGRILSPELEEAREIVRGALGDGE